MRKLGFYFALCLLTTAPVFAQKVIVDYDRQFDFGGATKIDWAKGGTPAPSELTEKRIRTAIEEELKKKGMVFVAEGEQSDLHIITHAAVDEQAKQSAASDALKSTAEKNEQLLNKAVQKAFKDFPPKEKNK